MLALKATAAVSVLVLALAGGGVSARDVSGATRRTTEPPWTSEPQVEFGFIKSMTPLGTGYRLRVDLHQLFGPDKTGISACVDNHECPPGTHGFLDDTYDHDFKYVLTYYVPPNAPVELVGFYPKPNPRMTARYFYALVHGKNPHHVQAQTMGRDALSSFGFLIEVGKPDARHYFGSFEPVRGLVQVYHP